MFTPATRSLGRVVSGPSAKTQTISRSLHAYNTTREVVTVIPGDGIGPEIINSCLGVLQAVGAPVAFEKIDPSKYTGQLHSDLVASISRNRLVLKGPFHTEPISEVSRNSELRKLFSVHANVVHLRNFEGVESRHKDIDIVVVRESSEGEYMGMESEIVPGVIQSLKVTTSQKTRRIAEFAFDYTKKNGRKKVTVIHKANIQKLTDGLFLEECRKVAKENPEIKYEEMIVDNTCMQLVMNPNQFDVMLTPNLYGNMVINVAAGLTGGPGLVVGKNVGKGVTMFEPGARHVGIDIQGSDKANPAAMILCGADLLRSLDLEVYASRVEDAVHKALASEGGKTQDLGGKCGTKEFTKRVIALLE